jgi:hypothetical protein
MQAEANHIAFSFWASASLAQLQCTIAYHLKKDQTADTMVTLDFVMETVPLVNLAFSVSN